MIASIGKRKIFFEKQGRGEPIIFVHGWGGQSASMKALATLASEKYETVIVDLPGFGQSDPPDANWGIAEYSGCLRDIIQKLGYKKITYFGHSFGGSIGIYLAANHPELIDALILCAPSYHRGGGKVRSIGFVKELIPRPLKLLLYRIFFPASDISRFPALEQNFRRIVREDMGGYLSKIRQRTLILWGDQDTYTPVANTALLNNQIVGSKLVIFEGVGHSAPLQYPERVYREIESFL